jgi:alanine racemase
MRPTWAEINLKALSHNFIRTTEIVGEKVKVLAVVKADAYGHGAVKVSKTLQDLGCDLFGVATVDEALELRESYIKAPILILSGINSDEIETVVKYKLTPVIFSVDLVKKLNNYGSKNNTKIKYHLKIDTGMNRLGIDSNKLDEYISDIQDLNNVIMEGAFTHLSSAESDKSYTMEQISIFKQSCAALNNLGFKPAYKHCANSAALQRFKDSHFNLVRPGIMIYGACGAEDVYLHPVMKLKSKIIQIKRLPKGSKVSYGGTFVTDRQTQIAVLPIGYADGYARHLSNKAVVSIAGSTAPVIGTVCMDLTIVDITDLKDINVGDEVVLFGDENIGVDELASLAGTISYELLSIVGKRVPRVYL